MVPQALLACFPLFDSEMTAASDDTENDNDKCPDLVEERDAVTIWNKFMSGPALCSNLTRMTLDDKGMQSELHHLVIF